jgi:hypothetical protein
MQSREKTVTISGGRTEPLEYATGRVSMQCVIEVSVLVSWVTSISSESALCGRFLKPTSLAFLEQIVELSIVNGIEAVKEKVCRCSVHTCSEELGWKASKMWKFQWMTTGSAAGRRYELIQV